MAIKGRANINLTSITDAIVQGTEPQKPTDGMLWLDNGQTPNVLKRYNATSGQWEIQTVSVADADPGLKEDVNHAKDTADSAKQQASQAEALATQIKATADAANASADAASGRADDALTKANNALTNAQTAFDKATDASTKADEAKGEVSSVKQTVQGVQTTVQSKADKSEVTQLANQLSTKISTVDADKKYASLSSFTQTSELLDSTISRVDSNALAAFRNIRYVRSWSNKNTYNSGNHWVEVQVFKDGENVALNKPVTSNPSVSGLEVVTDGVIDTLKYVSIGAAAAYVQIDLGQVYDTLDYAMVYRYWKDGRTYHDTKFEISSDGKTWHTVFDSKVSGEYAETENGFRISLSQAEYIEKIATESSAFTQMVDNINLKVSKGDVINQINLDTSGVLIKGKNITLDGDVTVSSSFKVPKAAINEIDGNVITAASIDTNKLKIGDFTNLLPNPNFTGNLDRWTVNSTNTAYAARSISTSNGYGVELAKTGSDLTQVSVWTDEYLPVTPGDKFYVSYFINQTVGTSFNGINNMGVFAFRYKKDLTSLPGEGMLLTRNPNAGFLEGIYTVPADVYFIKIQLYHGTSGTNTATANTAISLTNIIVRKATKGTMIEDGTITTDKLNVTSLSAISANLGTVTAGKITGAEFIHSIDYTDVDSNHYTGTVAIDDNGFNSIANLPIGIGSTYKHYEIDILGGLKISGDLRDANTPNGNQKSRVYLSDTSLNFEGYVGNMGLTATGLSSNGEFKISSLKGGEFNVTGDGTGPQIYSPTIYNRTYSSGSNVCVTSYGTLGRITSAAEYKRFIQPTDSKFDSFLNIEAKKWIDKNEYNSIAKLLKREPKESTVASKFNYEIGFIAEDLEAAGLEEYCIYAIEPDGTKKLEGIKYDRLTVPLLDLVKNLNSRLLAIENKEDVS